MPKSDPTTTDLDSLITHYERGIVHRTIGASYDTEYLDDAEAAEYQRGYDNDEGWGRTHP